MMGARSTLIVMMRELVESASRLRFLIYAVSKSIIIAMPFLFSQIQASLIVTSNAAAATSNLINNVSGVETLGSTNNPFQTAYVGIVTVDSVSFGGTSIRKEGASPLPSSPSPSVSKLMVTYGTAYGTSAFIDTNGKLYTCGYNNAGQLGNGTEVNRSVATDVSTFGSLVGTTIIRVSCASDHTIALDSTGKVHAWGENTYGQLGNNMLIAKSNVPIIISTFGSLVGKTITSVSSGMSCTLALDSTGKVHAWGNNSNGQLGNNTVTQSNIPIAISAIIGSSLVGKTITSIACGALHTLALDSTGQVHAWGFNAQGQLGNNTTTQSNIPIAISSFGSLVGTNIVAVVCGGYHNLALDSSGQMHAWGNNAQGVLGNNTTTQSNIPIAISSFGSLVGKTITSFSCGGYHNLALDSTGKVHAWGRGVTLETYATQSNIPVAISEIIGSSLVGKVITAVSSGELHNLALDATGQVHTWGTNNYGQLGNNTRIDALLPTQIQFVAQPNMLISGNIISAGNIIASYMLTNSDDRIKANEVFISDATVTLNKLRPQIYDKYSTMDYRTDSNATFYKESGIMAQEIFYDAPELRHLVNLPSDADKIALYDGASNILSSTDPSLDPSYPGWGSNIAAVNYTGLIPYLIKAIQEKDDDIRALVGRVTALETQQP